MDNMLLADLIAVVHLAYFLFIVVGQAAIVLGWLRAWSWVRNFAFRVLHLAAMLIVGVEAALAIPCPLTVWERELRTAAGQSVSEASFMARLANLVMFHDFPEWVFTAAHIAFAGLVLATFLFYSPRWPWKRTPAPASAPAAAPSK